MRNSEIVESGDTQGTSVGTPLDADGLPHRLLTTYEVAAFVGCHEETVRRAYLRGLLVSQRFGVRCRRFRREDVLDWIGRGAPTMARVRAERGVGRAATRADEVFSTDSTRKEQR